uniref:Uncharacterized protein n=1 Tax=Physcomitrium patens TaxID=3218 RepID=A0A2K1J2K5_PHYPA|nr:hypothetical protein PHYPA_021607 [Physcomitrium patens]
MSDCMLMATDEIAQISENLKENKSPEITMTSVGAFKDMGGGGGGEEQWIPIRGVAGVDVAILNLYAPLISVERCELSTELLHSLPRDCRWILGGS